MNTKPKLEKKKLVAPCLLAAIFLVQAAQLAWWAAEDTANPAWDQSWHAMKSLDFYRQLSGTSALPTAQAEAVYPILGFANGYYPPLFHAAAAPFYLALGESYDAAILSNMLFLAILIASSFLIGRKMRGNEAGLLMAFIASTVPGYGLLMRDYTMDFALSSMVALGLAALLYAKDFEATEYSMAFGAVAGLGLLTKWTYPIYLAVPVLYSLYAFARKNRRKKRMVQKALRNVALPMAIALLIAASWYTPSRLESLVPLLSSFSGMGAAEGDPSFATLGGMTYYASAMLSDFSLLYVSLFLTGAFAFFMAKKRNPMTAVLIAQLVFALLLFTVLSNKDYRYAAPVYVFSSAVAALWAAGVKDARRRHAVIAAIVVIGLAQSVLLGSGAFGVGGRPPAAAAVDINGILAAISADSPGGFSVCVAAESPALNDVNVPYYSMAGNYPARLAAGNGCNPLAFGYTIEGPIDNTWRSGGFEMSRSVLLANMHLFREIYSENGVTVYRRV